MYGSSQSVIGYGLERLGRPETLFSAEKVWTSSADGGAAQIERSRRFWGIQQFDLVQVHNLVAWEAHLKTLFEMKAAGQIRYVGITTSHGRRHDLVEQIMRARTSRPAFGARLSSPRSELLSVGLSSGTATLPSTGRLHMSPHPLPCRRSCC
jgi:diketogulonate reductase-like aldo/keto reductase